MAISCFMFIFIIDPVGSSAVAISVKNRHLSSNENLQRERRVLKNEKHSKKHARRVKLDMAKINANDHDAKKT